MDPETFDDDEDDEEDPLWEWGEPEGEWPGEDEEDGIWIDEIVDEEDDGEEDEDTDDDESDDDEEFPPGETNSRRQMTQFLHQIPS